MIVKAGKAGSANTRGTCYRVWMRHTLTGRWEPVSVDGFVIVCPSLLEAKNMILMLGIRYFPTTAWGLSIDTTDEQYVEWLMNHFLKLDPYVPRGKDTIIPGVDRKAKEVSFALWQRGWAPSKRDVLGQDVGATPKPKDSFQRAHWDL